GAAEASTSWHGPSPSVSCSSASCSPTGSVTHITKSGSRPADTVTQAPLTCAHPAATAHTSATDTRRPVAAACPATRPHTTAGRPAVIPAARYGPAATAATRASHRHAPTGQPARAPSPRTGYLTAPASRTVRYRRPAAEHHAARRWQRRRP